MAARHALGAQAGPAPVGSAQCDSRRHCADFFTTVGSDMVLLHGIVKKSGKTPSADLATAKRRRDEVMR
ncbi:type II toxin-antitoxin system RelE/ParE family toxin [Xanthomonas sp. F4]